MQIPNDLKQRDKGVWVLNANQYPAVLIEAGFLTTQKDLDYLSKTQNQKIIAQNILNGIGKYAEQNLLNKNNTSIIQDTAQNITSTDQIKKFIQDRISEMKENSPQKDFLMNKLSELKGNSFKKEVNIDSIPQYYNGKKIKEARGSEKLNKALISYEDGSKDTMSIAEAEKIKLIPPPPPPRISVRKRTLKSPVK